MKWPRVTRCNDGRIQGWDGSDERPQWHFHHCDTCKVVTWPYVIRWIDPTWWISMTPVTLRGWYRDLVWWVHERTEAVYWTLDDYYAGLVGMKKKHSEEDDPEE